MIDSVYDAAENIVDGIGKILGVDTQDRGAPIQARAGAPSSNAVQLPGKRTLALGSGDAADPDPGSGIVVSSPSPFLIIEAFNAERVKIWIVTDGRLRAECRSRAFAEDVLASINAKLAGKLVVAQEDAS